jgi:arabinose-5-phosphate isomerase
MMNWECEAKEILEIEAAAILRASERLDASFEQALDLLDGCVGKVITTGVGKSGIAARKLAATLTSTGCAAVYLHPAEAMHGDLGIVEADDVVVALSNSGESEEVLAILPAILARNVPILAIVGNTDSTLSRKAAVTLDASIEREACPLNLAPTTSVVVAMALGDALAMTLEKRRGFRPEDYALNHPGGRLGRRLTLRVRDVMGCGEDALPLVLPDAPLLEVLAEISSKHMGAACVAQADRTFAGFIAESDVRRVLQEHQGGAFALTAQEIMNPTPALIFAPEMLAYAALQEMENRPRAISVAPVLDADGCCVGMLRVHDLVKAGL